MRQDETADCEDDEEAALVASDAPEPPFTWREWYQQCVDVCARHALGWFAFAILLVWVADGMAHHCGWYDLMEYGNVETDPWSLASACVH